MKIRLYLGGIEFELDSERDLIINPEFCKFQKDCPGAPKVSIKISWDWEHATLPESEMVGADLLHRYYQEDNKCFCTALGGYKGLIASTWYLSPTEYPLLSIVALSSAISSGFSGSCMYDQ